MTAGAPAIIESRVTAAPVPTEIYTPGLVSRLPDAIVRDDGARANVNVAIMS